MVVRFGKVKTNTKYVLNSNVKQQSISVNIT